jgi:hypothetical protein
VPDTHSLAALSTLATMCLHYLRPYLAVLAIVSAAVSISLVYCCCTLVHSALCSILADHESIAATDRELVHCSIVYVSGSIYGTKSTGAAACGSNILLLNGIASTLCSSLTSSSARA